MEAAYENFIDLLSALDYCTDDFLITAIANYMSTDELVNFTSYLKRECDMGDDKDETN